MSHLPNPRPCGDFRTSYGADASLYRTRPAFFGAIALVAFALILPPLMEADTGIVWPFTLAQLVLIGIYGIGAIGLNVLVGFTGQISLGHAAFFGFGAFTSAYLSKNGIILPWIGQITEPVPVIAAIPLAALYTMAIGLLFGLPAARLKGLYLAIATLAAQFILQDFFNNAEWFTGGSRGSRAATPEIWWFWDKDFTFGLTEVKLRGHFNYYYLVLFWLVISVIAVSNLRRSRDGRALVAVRDHYLSAEIMGINLTRYRVLAFGISALFAGLAGALYGHYLRYVTVESFTIRYSIDFLAMIIIGGLGSVSGSLLGAAFILILPQPIHYLVGQLADQFPSLEQGTAYMQRISIGLALILFLILEPEGLIHLWRRIRASFKLFPFSH